MERIAQVGPVFIRPQGERPSPQPGAIVAKTFKVGRDAKTGEFITVKEAKNRPATAIVETIKKK